LDGESFDGGVKRARDKICVLLNIKCIKQASEEMEVNNEFLGR